jgi:phage gp36-like protein
MFSKLPQEVQDLANQFDEWLRNKFFPLMSIGSYPEQEVCQENLLKRFTEDEIREKLRTKGSLDAFTDEMISNMAGRLLQATDWGRIDIHTSSFTVVGNQIWFLRRVYPHSTEWNYRGRPNFCIVNEDNDTYSEYYLARVRPLDDEARSVIREFVRLNDALAASNIPWGSSDHHDRKKCGEDLASL